MQDPILYVGRFEHELTELIHEHGDYLYMVFAWCCLLFIAWLVLRKRKWPPRQSLLAGPAAVVNVVVVSPASSSDADGSPTRPIIPGDLSRN